MRHKKFSSIGKRLDPRYLFKTKRKINEIIVHCTANSSNPKLGAKYVDHEHLKRWGKNSGCGYHYVIRTDGTLEKGRWADFAGAHARGRNRNSIGVSYVGGLDKRGHAMDQGMTPKQLQTMQTLLHTLTQIYGLNKYAVKGHNELPHVNKACPCTPMDKLRNSI